MRNIILALCVLSLAACATCKQHPTVCAVAGAVVVGSVVATIKANSPGHSNGPVPPQGPFGLPTQPGKPGCTTNFGLSCPN